MPKEFSNRLKRKGLKNKINKISKESLNEHREETDAKAKFLSKAMKAELKGEEPLIPKEQLLEFNKRVLKRRDSEKKMKKALKPVKKG